MEIRSTIYFGSPIKFRAPALVAEIKRLFPKFASEVESPVGTVESGNIIKLGSVVIAILNFDLP